VLGWTALVCVLMISKLDKRARPISARGFALCILLLTTLLVSSCGRVTADGKIDRRGPSGSPGASPGTLAGTYTLSIVDTRKTCSNVAHETSLTLVVK
jgi:hypothetical protein